MSVLLLTSSAAALEPIRIVLHANAAVDGDAITLGEAAAIEGADQALVDQLQSLEVGRAPLPGQSLLLHRHQVELRLKQHDLDPDRFEIQDAGPVKVLRNHKSISPERIAAVVRDHIQKYAPWSAEQMTIRPIQYNQSHRVPPGEVAFRVTAPKHVAWVGAVPFRVQILVDGQTVQRASVPTYIEVWQDVLLAAKPLGRNQPITAEDVKIERMNMARVPTSAILDMGQAVGRRANRPIAVNSVLRSDQMDLPPVIRRGDVVQVVAESDTLRITTQAVAQDSGGVGEMIRVMNARSRQNIHAEVVNGQTVRVMLQ
ncbi:MAG: flagellar basal body P-ring formation protein FlgA [Desulfatitalea sp.]|nr:flagellar basal body P-ring formation protein FlgA [Desulfatitalea sp.]